MMRPGTANHLSIAAAARIAGIDYRTLRKHGEAGLVEIRRRGPHYSVERSEMMRYLRDNGYEPDLWRPAFQPSGGHLLVVKPASDLPVSLLGCAPLRCRSILEMGKYLGSRPVWGVVIDFVGVGRSAAVEAAAELRADAPLLIAVTAEDEVGDGLEGFDLLVARPIHVDGFVAGLIMLRRSVEQLSPGQPTAGGRYRRRRKGVPCPKK